MSSWCIALALVCLTATSVTARTWHINPDGTGDWPTIRTGALASTAGDTVEVACGLYAESGITLRPGVVIRSTTGDPGCVRIIPSAFGRIIYCDPTPGQRWLEGVTIADGDAAGGAAVWCVDSVAWIRDCIFESNQSMHDGGAIVASHGDLLISNCTFASNSLSGSTDDHSRGGAIYLNNESSAEINGCTFSDNVAANGGAIWARDSELTLSNCVLRNNMSLTGGAVLTSGNTTLVVESCAFADNAADIGGAVRALSATMSTVESSTFYGNSALPGSAQWDQGTVASISNCVFAFGVGGAGLVTNVSSTMSCTDVFGNAGGDWVGSIAGQLGSAGNFSADPLFCGPASADLGLQVDSPCLPGQHPEGEDCGLIGAFGEGCAAVSVEAQMTSSTWATIKSAYRTRSP